MLKISNIRVAVATAALCVFVLILTFAVPATAQDMAPDSAQPLDPRSALIEVLRDDGAREALIAELERASGAAMEPAIEEPPPVSFSRQIAAATQASFQNLATGAASLWSALQRVPEAWDDLGLREMAVVAAALQDLVLVIASTIIAFVVLRALARLVYVRMGARAEIATVTGRWIIFFVSGLVDAAVVALSWAIGYALAATVIGQFGEIAIRQSLYLNAFLAVELVKVAVRLVISPTTGTLRPLPISDGGAKRLYGNLNIAISLIGYGLLLLVPIMNANASFAAGRSMAIAVVIVTALYLGLAALRHRKAVADWLIAQGRTPVPALDFAQTPAPPDMPEGDDAPDEADAPLLVEGETGETAHLAKQPSKRGAYAIVARNWHWIALLWLGFLGLTVLTRPLSGVFDVVRASALIGLTVFVAVAVSGMIGRAIGRGVTLPASVNERLPRLEARLNGFVPQFLTVLRIVLMVVVAFLAIGLSGLLDLQDWLASPLGLRFVGTIMSVLAILVVGFVLWLSLTSWVEYRLNPDFGTIPTARAQTLLTLVRNALTVVLLVLTLMFALSEIGLDIGPLLASAGVLGLAIGFGAQKLVQDVITGVFIQLDNAMNVGDVVTAGPVTGVVEKLTIRSVSLRDLQGIYHLIPFSSVDAVSNFTRDFSQYLVDMGVAYREDTDEAKAAMFDAYDELRSDPEHAPSLLGDLEWFGLDKFADSAVILRARIKTLPGKQWGVGRAYNRILKRVFDERGIEIPFPHTTLYLGENKKGETQPIRVEHPAGQT